MLDLKARLAGGISLEVGTLTVGKYLRPVGIAIGTPREAL